ncbi:MAG: thioredoxin [Clostridia bacterium]|jgi:thioredoxin 1|nr:thioredoxin [Clostridia bacterium]
MAKIIGSHDFNQEVIAYQGVSLVDFYADWCGPCKMIAPAIEELSAEMAGRAKVLKLNVDQSQDIAGTYGVMSIPTLIIFKDGKVAEKIVGAQPKPVIKSKLESYL